MVVDELDDQLRGTKPGAILEFSATLPERFGELAGSDANFRVIVKEAKQKVLPDLSDEWAAEASEFETVEELRADIRKRVETMQRLQAQMALRDKVLEAVADLVPIEAPPTLVDYETPPARRGSRPPPVAPGCEPRAVPRGHGSGAAGLHRRDPGGRRTGRARRPRAARGRRARGASPPPTKRSTPRSRDWPNAPNRRSPRCGASSNGVARWRRYALMLPVERRSSSSSITRPWSTRTGTRST